MKFERLTVVAERRLPQGYDNTRSTLIWECLCDCGKTTLVPTGKLKSGHTKSCGCLLVQRQFNRRTWEIVNSIKTCKRCNGTEFYNDRCCKHCLKAGSSDRYRKASIQELNAQSKAWRDKNPEKRRDIYLKRTYGVPHGTYEKLFTEQRGVCAICGASPLENVRLHLDHCHETDTVRGLLCNSCNVGLSRFKDNPESLQSAITYLWKSSFKHLKVA